MRPDLRRSITAAAFRAGDDPDGTEARYFTRKQWSSLLAMDTELRRLRKGVLSLITRAQDEDDDFDKYEARRELEKLLK